MSTKLYLTNSGSNFNCSFSNYWETTAQADRTNCVTTKYNESLITKSIDLENTRILSRQFISPPLASGQTLSGTINGQLLCFEASRHYDVTFAMHAYLVNSTGGFIGTLYQGGQGSEYSYAQLTNRYAPPTGNINTVSTVGINNRIILEYGCDTQGGGVETNGASNTFGVITGQDLPINQTQTNNYNPWVEFSKNIGFV